jgi:succinoglycan biosynthesis transport protein ExoP
LINQVEASLQEGPLHIREYLALLRARKWSILIVAAATIVLATFFSLGQTPIYESKAEVLVKPLDIGPAGSQPIVPNTETERKLVTAEPVARVAAKKLDVPDARSLLDNVLVRVAPNTEILEIYYSDPDPQRAQEGAQAFAEGYLQYRREEALNEIVSLTNEIQQRIDARNEELIKVTKKLARVDAVAAPEESAELEAKANTLEAEIAILEQERIDATAPEDLSVGQVVVPAGLPTQPSSPNHLVNLALGLVVGVALGVAFAFLRERLDDRLRGREQLESLTGVPVLAIVPRVPMWKRRSEIVLVSISQPQSAAAEAYKTLRTGVLYAARGNDRKVLIVTSPQAGEGKTVTTANLGVALAQAGKRVILISADLRKPRLHSFFDVRKDAGLTDVLVGQKTPDEVIGQKGESLQILPSGPVPANPAELLGSDAMGRLLQSLRHRADFILIDAPPLLAVTDAMTLAPFVDGVLFVADAGTTTRGSITHALKQLTQVNAPLIGAVLNNFDPARGPAYSYYGYRSYYTYETEQAAPTGGNGESAAGRLLRRRL